MALKDVLKNLPTIGRDMVCLMLRPRKFVLEWNGRTERPSNKEVLGWGLAVSALTISLYGAFNGRSLTEDIIAANGDRTNLKPITRATAESRPEIVLIGWQGGLGIGVYYLEMQEKTFNQPQLVLFDFGSGQMLVKNVIPSKMASKVATLLLLNLYLYSIALCMFPGMRIWTRSVSFTRILALANLFIGTLWVVGSVSSVLVMTLYAHILNLKGQKLIQSIAYTATLPLAVLALRAFWSSFRALSGLSMVKVLTCLPIAWLISWVIFPVVFPLIFIVLRFQEFLNAVL